MDGLKYFRYSAQEKKEFKIDVHNIGSTTYIFMAPSLRDEMSITSNESYMTSFML